MTSQVDITNFKDLSTCDPDDVIKRTGCRYDRVKNEYRVAVWGFTFIINLNENEIHVAPEGFKTYNEFMHIFILHYLMKSKNIPLSHDWVSEKDIQGGAAFFRGPHTIPADVITDKVNNDISLFKRYSEKLGGIPIVMADAAYLFQITPTTPVAVLFWLGDKDFPSETKLLFDQTIEQHLPLDIIFALAVEVCHAFASIDDL